MKLKQLLLLAALVMPFSAGAAVVQINSTVDLSTLSDLSSSSRDFLHGTGYDYTSSSNQINAGDTLEIHVSFSNGLLEMSDTGVGTSGEHLGYFLSSESGSTTTTGFSLIGLSGDSPNTAFVGSSGGILGAAYRSSALLSLGETISFSGFVITALVNSLSSDGTLVGDLTGRFDATGGVGGLNVIQSAVPLPAAVWLFGPALLGFMGFRRKAVDTAAA